MVLVRKDGNKISPPPPSTKTLESLRGWVLRSQYKHGTSQGGTWDIQSLEGHQTSSLIRTATGHDPSSPPMLFCEWIFQSNSRSEEEQTAREKQPQRVKVGQRSRRQQQPLLRRRQEEEPSNLRE